MEVTSSTTSQYSWICVNTNSRTCQLTSICKELVRKTPHPGDPYLTILSLFLPLTQVCLSPESPIKRDIMHCIITSGPLVSARPRRLVPEWLKIARKEFGHMLQQGIIRPSSSAWSLPLPIVPKKTVEWHSCCDIALLIGLLGRTATQSHTSRIFHIHSKVPLFS